MQKAHTHRVDTSAAVITNELEDITLVLQLKWKVSRQNSVSYLASDGFQRKEVQSRFDLGGRILYSVSYDIRTPGVSYSGMRIADAATGQHIANDCKSSRQEISRSQSD